MVAFMKKYVWLVLSFVLLLTLCPIFPAAADISDEGYACYQFEDGMPEGVRLENATGKIQFGGVYGKGLLVTADSGEPKVLLPFFSESNVVYSFSVWIKSTGSVAFFIEDRAVTNIQTTEGEDGWTQFRGSCQALDDGSFNQFLTISGEEDFLVDDCLILSEKYHETAIAGNLVSNGSFEADLAGWKLGSEGSRIEDGANGTHHAISTTVNYDWDCAKTQVDIRFGRKYKLTWYAKAISDDADGLDMKYIFDRAPYMTDDRTPKYSEHIVGALTKEWQKFEVVHQDANNTPDQCLADLYFRAGSGKDRVTFAVDEINIEEIDDSYEVPSQVTVSGDELNQQHITATFGKKGSAVGIYYRIMKKFGDGFAIMDNGYTEDQTAVKFDLPDNFTGLCRVEINAVDIYGIVGKTFYSAWKPKGEALLEQKIITNINEEIWTDTTKSLTAETVCRGAGDGNMLMSAFAVYNDKGALTGIETADVENIAGNEVPLSVAVGSDDHRAKFMLFNKTTLAPVKQEDELTKITSGSFLYVDAENGRDYNSGEAGNPLKSLSGAKVKVRELLKTASEDIYVIFKEGEYPFGSAVTFTPNDTSDTLKIHYISEKKGKASFSGGREATNFSLWSEEKNIYRSYVGTDVETRQLFVDGIRATRAKSSGKLKDAVNLGNEGVGYTTTDISLLEFKHIEDLEFVFYEDWTNSYCGVDNVTDNGDGSVTVAMEPVGWGYQWKKGNCLPTVPEYIENALELLDEEGEWYLDRHEGYLYYKPRVFENMNEVRVVMPVCEKMLNLNGNSAFDVIRNLEFRGLVFENTTWNVPSRPGGFCCGQNNGYTGGEEQFIPGAVNVDNANNISFVNCRLTRLGMTGLKMTGGLKNCKVVGNEFYDISGGALVVGDVAKNNASDPKDPAYYVENIDVMDNYMHKIAVDYKGGAALSTGFPINSRINNNEIYDTCYSGMHLGWGWNSYTKTVTEDFTVKQNYIHKVMNTKIFDGGGVYFLGRTNGSEEHPNVFAENYLYDTGNCYGMIYPDNGSTNWDILSNVVDLNKNPVWYRKNDRTPENIVMPARWLHIHMSTITDIYLKNNYTTSDENLNNGIYNVKVEDLHVHNDADWPQEALDIIERAGVTPKYSDNFRCGLQEVDGAGAVTLKTGETTELNLFVQTGKEKLYHSANYEIYMVSSDENIVSVNGQAITGLRAGSAEITAYVKEADILQTKKIQVTVENLS